MGARRVGPEGGPKFRAFCPLSCHKICSSLSSLGVFSLNFGGVYLVTFPTVSPVYLVTFPTVSPVYLFLGLLIFAPDFSTY